MSGNHTISLNLLPSGSTWLFHLLPIHVSAAWLLSSFLKQQVTWAALPSWNSLLATCQLLFFIFTFSLGFFRQLLSPNSNKITRASSLRIQKASPQVLSSLMPSTTLWNPHAFSLFVSKDAGELCTPTPYFFLLSLWTFAIFCLPFSLHFSFYYSLWCLMSIVKMLPPPPWSSFVDVYGRSSLHGLHLGRLSFTALIWT